MISGKRDGQRWFARRVTVVALAALFVAYVHACARGSDRQSAGDSTSGDSAKSTGAANARAASAPPPTALSGRRLSLLFAGTSITAGLGLEPDSAYPMLIQRKIDSAGLPFEVTNAGVSGETSSGLLQRLEWLLRGDFKVIVVETGANDGLRNIPVPTLRSNLEAIVDRIHATRPDAAVALVQMEALPNFGPRYASDFHAAYPRVARERRAALIPFLLTDVAGHHELNQSDGIHPNVTGERMVAENVWRALRPLLDSVARAR